ncbi:hypothetical protein [Endothiovibrio diazotrophicus]
MAKRKPIEKMSAEELYALAQQREQEERDAQSAATAEQLEELKARRKELSVQHKAAIRELEKEHAKELKAIDREIAALGGRAPRRTGGGGGRRSGASQAILELIGALGPVSTSDLKVKLEEQGIDTKNLPQQLAYLKRQGKVTAPSRAVYALA